MQSMSQSNFEQKEISQLLLKPNFKALSESEEGFQRCGFPCPFPSPYFIPPKNPGLIGLNVSLPFMLSFRCFRDVVLTIASLLK